ncbi:hypothetical protein BKA69DRAFT_1170581 [Paraphysoderma sedebokerense]|nr:hypothetical protein BKA69DRAFT_1170581 [Paraphysoderma sedebokerense]
MIFANPIKRLPLIFHGGDPTCKPETSVVIQVVDACPGVGHKINEEQKTQYNREQPWCADNLNHVDLNLAAFKQIANIDAGIINMQYRVIPCPQELGPRKIDHQPDETVQDPDILFGKGNWEGKKATSTPDVSTEQTLAE